MWDRAKSFVKKAGTIILLASIVVWVMSNLNWGFQMVEDVEESILASLGNIFAPLFTPLGWGNWKAAVAAINGLVAKENVVSTFGILYRVAEEQVGESGEGIWSLVAQDYTQLSAYSFLIFNLICAPCFAAIGAIKREMGNAKWTTIALVFQTGLAYVMALIFYQLGILFTGGGFGLWTVVALAALAVMLYLLFRPEPKISK